MKINFIKKKRSSLLTIGALTFIALISFQSCKQTYETVNEEGNGIPSTVNINIAGVAYEELDQSGSPSTKASTSSTPGLASDVQKFVMPFNEDLAIFGSLEPVKNADEQIAVKAAAGNKAAVVNTPLTPGTRYTILVYNADGSLNQQQVFTYGSGATTLNTKLDGGKTYTFIAVSINSTSTNPTITGNTLSTATVAVANTTNYLMYFKKQITLTAANTNLDVVLKHQFSQITTKVTVNNQLNNKYLNSISGVSIAPANAAAIIKLTDGSLTYSSPISTGAEVTFPAITGNQTTLTSSPTNILAPFTTGANLTIGSISINGESKSNLTQSNLNINPGHKYNLNLNFAVPCTQDVIINGGFNPNYSNLTEGGRTPESTITAPGADYGFVLNIYELDNSFNMKVNGVALATKELQFQSGVTNNPINIEFTNGTVWGDAGVSQIYNITNGTDAAPSLRVSISPEGVISMFGRKSSTDMTLYPLRLRSGTSFNTITWNKTGNNEIKVDQLVTGPTKIRGNGIGKKIVPCTL